MPKVPSTKVSSAPFPFVRQFTTPPFFVGLEDAKLKGQLLVDAVQHAGKVGKKAPAKRTAGKKSKRKGAGKRAAPRK